MHRGRNFVRRQKATGDDQPIRYLWLCDADRGAHMDHPTIGLGFRQGERRVLEVAGVSR
ncbi:MAG: hypothetical protein ACK56I_16015 [bacterium]